MDPNATTTAPTAAAATPGYPVIPPQQQQQQHYGQQFPFHPSAMSSPFPQAKPPSQQPSFGAVPFSQAGGPGGAATMMPAAAGFPPQHSSGMLVIFFFYCPFFIYLLPILFACLSGARISWWDVALDYCKLDVPARAGHTCSMHPLFTPQSGPTGLLDLHVCDYYTHCNA